MRILSGLQPSGRLHIGNFFGMMEPALKLQHEGDAYYFIADYHSLTSVHDGKALRGYVRELAVDFLACGLDPTKCVFFRQSDVPEHTELSWILSTVTPMGLLERCHSYKDKIANGISASHGLFAYPVLMAADILLYESDVVPVGRDQKQHVEVTRDIAIKMNETFGAGLFKLPNPRIQESTAVVPGLDGQKMSKSYDNTIPLFAPRPELKKLIAGIKTDSRAPGEAKSTEGSALFQIYQAFASAEETAAFAQDFANGIAWGDAKDRLFERIDFEIAPMRARYEWLMAHPQEVEVMLHAGAAKARAVATPFMARLRQAVGLRSLATATTRGPAKAAKAAAASFKQYREKDGQFYFKLVDAKGALLLQSLGLDSPQAAGKAIALLKAQGAGALAELQPLLAPFDAQHAPLLQALHALSTPAE